jgi:hypothetical protein
VSQETEWSGALGDCVEKAIAETIERCFFYDVDILILVVALAADDTTLAASDYGALEKFLQFFIRQRTPVIARHWGFLLRPMSLYHTERAGVLRYTQIECHRMPLDGLSFTIHAFSPTCPLSRPPPVAA